MLRPRCFSVRLAVLIIFFMIFGSVAVPCFAQSDDTYQYCFLEAVCQQEKGNHAEAYELLERCRQIRPNSSEVFYMLSRYYYFLNKPKLAREMIEKAGELAPKNDYYQELIAEYCIQDKEYDKAIAALERIYDNDHERGDVLERLVQLGSSTENYDKAIWALNKLEVLDGKSERISLSKYRIYLDQKKDREALDELQALANTYFNDLNYKVLLGDYYVQHDRFDEARAIYGEVLGQEPLNMSAQASLYRYFIAKDDRDSSEVLMQTMLTNPSYKSDEKVSLIAWAIGENRKAGKDSVENIKLFRTVLAQPQENATMQRLYANYLEYINMPKDTIVNAYEQVYAMEPDNEEAVAKLISYAWEDKNFDRAIELCRPARQYHPEELLFYYYEGLAQFQKEDRDAAIDVFERGISTINDKSNPEIVSDFYAILGDLYYQKGMKKAAYCAYDSCLQWKEDNIGCLNNYAYYMSVEGIELERAEKMSYKTIRQEKDNSTYLDTYAWILFKMKRYAEARIYIDKAVEHIDTTVVNTEIYSHAGDIYALNNEIEKAVEFWNQALTLTPNDKLLQKKIRKRKYYTK